MTPDSHPRAKFVEGLCSDDRRFWPLAAVVFGLLSFVKGIRVPSRYNATQALVDYSSGVIKRGFFGATVGHRLHLEHFSNFVMVSYVLLLAMVGVFALLMVRRGVLRGVGAGEPVAIFAASFAVTSMVDETGLMDIPLALLTMALLAIRSSRLRFAAAVPVCVVALLTHELFLLVFLPVLLLSFLVDAVRGRGLSRRMAVAMVASLALLCLAVTMKLALHAPLTVHGTEVLRQTLQARADFPLQGLFFPVLLHSTRDNVRLMWPLVHARFYQIRVRDGLLILLPTICMLLYAIRRTTRVMAAGKERSMLVATATFAALVPFAMNALGFDFLRFTGLVCWSCVLVLAVVAPGPGEVAVALPPWYRNAAILVIALSMISGAGLQDNLEVRTYPFLSGVHEGISSLLHRHWVPPPL